MEYMTTKEAAQKWAMTTRRVQELCKQELIIDVVRMGKAWMIPTHAKKPVDHRRKKSHIIQRNELPLLRECPFLIMSDLYNQEGSNHLIEMYKNENEISLFLKAQFAYFRGDYEEAYSLTQYFLSYELTFYLHLGVGMLLALCANCRGDVLLWDEAKKYMMKAPCQNQNERYQLAFWIAAIDSTIDDRTHFPEWFQQGNFDLLPKDSYPFAQFFYIKYLFLVSQETSINAKDNHQHFDLSMKMISAICEPLISQLKLQGAILPEIYLRILCAMAYYNNGNEKMAILHIDKAILLAFPDKLLSPFAETRHAFGYLMDDCIAKVDKKLLSKVKTLSKIALDGWVFMHNMKLGRTKTNDLTIREREVSRLATYGYTNAEIAKQLHISLHTVKQALRHAMEKTNCKKRLDLIKYI